MKIVNVRQARARLSRLLRDAQAGEDIVIARRGKPYARLVPVTNPKGKREPGTLAGRVSLDDSFFDPLPPGWG